MVICKCHHRWGENSIGTCCCCCGKSRAGGKTGAILLRIAVKLIDVTGILSLSLSLVTPPLSLDRGNEKSPCRIASSNYLNREAQRTSWRRENQLGTLHYEKLQKSFIDFYLHFQKSYYISSIRILKFNTIYKGKKRYISAYPLPPHKQYRTVVDINQQNL